jgi:hypothetical protein
MAIKHKATYTRSYGNRTTVSKVFDFNDFNDSIKLADKKFNHQFIVNVPCYKVEDVALAIHGMKSNYFALPNHLLDCIVNIRTSNHHGRQFEYILSTPSVDEYIKQNALFGILKGNTNKMPKLHSKVVCAYHRGTGYGPRKLNLVECYIADKELSTYLNKEVAKREV